MLFIASRRISDASRAVLALLVFLASACTSKDSSNCTSLANLKLPGTTITRAATEYPPFSLPDPPAPPGEISVPICRVQGIIKPTADSSIRFEVWLPLSGWNGKYLGLGSGGLAGAIHYHELAKALSSGYATSGTDDGHPGNQADGGYGTDGSWALGHPSRVIDYGYRAVHETAEKSKAIVATFYGRSARRAYFEGCSEGGREALMEAQRFPADYDGLIAGAPINAFTHFMDGILSIEQALAEPGGYVAPKKLPVIEAAIESACDALDGVKDGIVSEPMKCQFDPSVLLCKGAETDRCLTAAQIAALKKIYAGPSDSGGLPIFPGLEPSAYVLGGWAGWVSGSTPGKSILMSLVNGYFANFVFENPKWNFRNFDWDKDVRLSDEKSGAVLNATSPDLNRFEAGGGKLLIYHGWADEVVAPRASIDYYQGVAAAMGGAEKTATFARLFMVPGMEHCGGAGSGPSVIDATATMDRWMETGAAPEQMIATKYVDDDPAGAVAMARPVCAYPRIARYKGAGDPNLADSFECRKR